MTLVWERQKSVSIASLGDARIERENLELWEGEIVPHASRVSPAGWYHGEISSRLFLMFVGFCRSRYDLWRCGDNNGFVVSRDPETLLSPDAALFRKRPAGSGPWREFCPELPAEVMSMDTLPELLAKRDLYLRGGAEQLWLVDPSTRKIEVHFADGRKLSITSGVMTGEGIAEGLTVDLAELFDDAPFGPEAE